MRLVTFEKDGSVRVGVRTEQGVIPTDYADMIELIRDGEAATARVRKAAETGTPVPEPRLLAPIPRPGKVLCCGVNYASHKEENPNAVFPEEPFFFAKLNSAVIGPSEPIVIPSPKSQVDYEVELAFVIGRTAKHVKRQDALSYVFGYTVANDVSGRDVQFKDQQITLGKGFDTFCPLGPEIVTAEEIGDPSALTVSSYVNGERRQHASTSEMLFDIPFLIEFLTANITLEPGDVITTGTPAGVGCFRNPPVYLAPGDVVTVEADRIGKLTNPVIAGWSEGS
jgi:2-keto-4-pentenoate hydratase/2-oxohepta-3-ene-1,7-dioic acid hydratase in catechol pathway